MKHFSSSDPFNLKEDIQIQVPTSRLGIMVQVDSDIELKDIWLRVRLVSGNGTKTTIEKLSLRDLFQIGASQAEGFYRRGVVPGQNGAGSTTVYRGSIIIGKDGALDLSTGRYLTADLGLYNSAHQFVKAAVNSITHPKIVSEYIHYNPVTINQSVQNVPLDNAKAVVLPLQNISKIQLGYPGQNCDFSQDELGFMGDMLNDLVSVSSEGVINAGYEDLIVVPTRDEISAQEATRLQIERNDNAPNQFNVILLEHKTA